jgi:hypothetical protein
MKPWAGGLMPFPPNQIVQVKFRDTGAIAVGPADLFTWDWKPGVSSERIVCGYRTNGKTVPMPQPNSNEVALGRKDDTGKARFDLIPPKAELCVADVLTFGAKKYAPNNWRKVDGANERYIAAARRHLNQYQQGEMYDEDSSLPHLAHAIVSLMFVLQLDIEEIEQC